MMDAFYVSVPYYSLPEFPDKCALVSIRDILPRDILLCNPSNHPHRVMGIQYDPAIECGLYRICEPRVRQSIRTRLDAYDNLFIVFRTTFRKLDGSRRFLVMGYYEIDRDLTANAADNVIHAAEMKFVSIRDAIDITQEMTVWQAYRPPFTSENAKYEGHLVGWAHHLSGKQDRSHDYVSLIDHLKTDFEQNEFKNQRYSACSHCAYLLSNNETCPLIHRQNHWTITNLSRFYNRIFPCP